MAQASARAHGRGQPSWETAGAGDDREKHRKDDRENVASMSVIVAAAAARAIG